MGIENSRLVGGRSSGAISKIKLKGDLEVLGDQRVIETGEAVDVLHHASWSVKDLKEITEKLLGPSADLVDGTVVFQNFSDSTAIA